MPKKLILLLLLSLLSAQIVAPLHMAEHGFDEHEHEGQQCDIYLYAKHQAQADTTSIHNISTAFSYAFIQYHNRLETYELTAQHNYIQPRAPPFIA